MKRIAAALLLAVAANAVSFEELNSLTHASHEVHSTALNKCSATYTGEISGRVKEICQKNKWAASQHVSVYNPDTKESCFVSCNLQASEFEVSRSFISEEEAEKIAQEGTFRSMADEEPKRYTQALLDLYKKFYPEVNFSLDWNNNQVNAYSKKDWFGKRYVVILGGLVRHESAKKEGISVVIAHELGHHFGGRPFVPGPFGRGMSCDGQADFIGVRDIMRTVYQGEEYIETAHKGTTQMAGFFKAPDSPVIPGGDAGCAHPPGPCRIATYYAALSLLHDKPGCAGH